MFEQDYIMRMIQQLADSLARIGGCKVEENYDEAFRLIDGALGDLLGVDVRLLRMMDADSIAAMLSNNHQLLVYLKLELEAVDIHRRMDEHSQADRLLQRIRHVARAGIAENGPPDDALQEVIDVIDTPLAEIS
jgi:hypothetical protein